MINLSKEIRGFITLSQYSYNTKVTYKQRLMDFADYLAEVSNSNVEEIILDEFYKRIDRSGKILYSFSMDVKIIDQYFLDQLYESYNFLMSTRFALSAFFKYLNRKYDFPILTDEMTFSIEEYKEKPNTKNSYVLNRHDILKFIQSLLKYSPNLERDSLFFLLLITTGSRSNEIFFTKVNEIDYMNDTIYRKKTKNGTSKVIILREGFGNILRRYVEKNHFEGENYVFNEGDRPISLRDFQNIFNYYLQEAKLPLTTLHKLRHSFATIMAESGMDVLIIQQLLGHKKINSTKTYIDPNYIRNVGMVIDENEEVYKHIRRYG